jgi:hypothetical protein
VVGLELGANDYLVKPFFTREPSHVSRRNFGGNRLCCMRCDLAESNWNAILGACCRTA